MPRQIDAFPANYSITNNPTQRLQFGPDQFQSFFDDIPEMALKAWEQGVQLTLKVIEDLTGLDFSSVQGFFESIIQTIKKVTGIDFTSWDTFVDSSVLKLNELVDDGLNIVDSFLTLFYWIVDKLTGIKLNFLDPIPFLEQISNWLVTPIERLLTPDSRLNAANLWGLIPATSIANKDFNPLWNADFQNIVSIAANAGWNWDSVVYYDNDVKDTAVEQGSALIVADGTPHALRSNAFPLSEGQRAALTCQVLQVGLTCTGSPITLDVVTYYQGSQVAVVPVAAVGVATGDASDWVNAPAGAVAATLSGAYTAPDDDSVDHVEVRLGVDAAATGGVIRFDAIGCTVTGGLLADLQTDYGQLQADQAASKTAFSTLLSSWWSDITGYTDWHTFVTAIDSDWQTYVTTESNLGADEYATIRNMIARLLGMDPNTGLFLFWTDVANLTNAFFDLMFHPLDQTKWDTFNTALDAVFNDMQSTRPDTSNFIQNLLNAFFPLIPALNIAGVHGLETLDSLIQGIFNMFAEALGWIPGVDATLAGLSQLFQGMVNDVGEALHIGGVVSDTLAIRNNIPAYIGIDPTVTASFPLTQVPTTTPTSGIPTSVSATSTNAVTGLVRCQNASNKGFVEWYGSGTVDHLYVNVYRMAQSGDEGTTQTTLTATAQGTSGVAVNSTTSTVYFSDASGVFKLAPGDPSPSAVAFTGVTQFTCVAVDSAGAIYTSDGTHIYKLSGASQTTLTAFPTTALYVSIAFGSDGSIYAADGQSGLPGTVYKLAPDGVTLTTITFNTNGETISGVAVDASGAVYVSVPGSYANSGILSMNGTAQTTLGVTGLRNPRGLTFDSSGLLYIADGNNSRIVTFDPSTGMQGTLPFNLLYGPYDVAVASTGSVYVADTGNNRIEVLGTMGLTAGTLEWLATSPDLATTLSANWGWLGWNFASTVPVKPGDVLAGEIVIEGNGTHKIAALLNSWMVNHPTALLKNIGATRNNTADGERTPLSIDPSDIGYTGNAPWMGFGIADVTPRYLQTGQTQQFGAAGTTTYTTPGWLSAGDHIDLVVLGAGGGGQGAFGALWAYGGQSGQWNSTTLTVGADIPVGANDLQIIVGAGGTGGAPLLGQNGGTGGSTIITWTDTTGTTQTLTGAGGIGGGSNTWEHTYGQSPGNDTVGDTTYFGGREMHQANNGNPPGGGAAGGLPLFAGYYGADGSAWVRMTQQGQ